MTAFSGDGARPNQPRWADGRTLGGDEHENGREKVRNKANSQLTVTRLGIRSQIDRSGFFNAKQTQFQRVGAGTSRGQRSQDRHHPEAGPLAIDGLLTETGAAGNSGIGKRDNPSVSQGMITGQSWRKNDRSEHQKVMEQSQLDSCR